MHEGYRQNENVFSAPTLFPFLLSVLPAKVVYLGCIQQKLYDQVGCLYGFVGLKGKNPKSKGSMSSLAILSRRTQERS